MRPGTAGAALVLAAGIGLSSSAVAHPHVFVDTGFVPVFEDGRLVGVETSWRFDPIYSEVVLADFDLDGDGALNADERSALVGVFFAELGDYGYFTRVGIDGEWHQSGIASDFWVGAEDGILSAGFTLRTDLPVADTVEFVPFDEEHFIAFQIADDTVIAVQASTAWTCEARRYDLVSWYFGPVTGHGMACERAGGTS